ncbi:prepilin peptidase [Mucisphaera sp.]|uniref:prepilin peptidase n=1 Tax=Mucisphaera sp. TaxID=2913024 RepID=UPI003D0CF602
MWLELIVYGFVLTLGLCVGSFLNVVILRLPEGLSVVHPPSRCPRCGYRLAACQNVPVLSWLLLRGRCAGCSKPISVQYPLIELAFGVMALGLCWWQIHRYSGELPFGLVVELLSPMLVVQVWLLACLLAATVIDARYYMIPLVLCWSPFLVAAVVFPGSVAGGWPAVGPWVGTGWVEPVMGLTLGVLVSMALLRMGVLKPSFADYEEVMQAITGRAADTDVAGENALYPHARREMLKEIAFLVPPAVGFVLGLSVASAAPVSGWLGALAGVLAGAAMGAGLVWGTRILGSLAFGKEAMGLGDVHLMAGVGAVLGWLDVTVAFFVAPFLGLLGTAVFTGLASLKSARARVIPYGPYLAGASVIALVAGDWLLEVLGFSAIFTP